MQLVERIERTHQSLEILEGPSPRAASYWNDYRGLEPMLSEKHSTALFMAAQACRRDECKLFDSDVSQAMINGFVITAPSVLRKLDKDMQSILNAGGSDAILYLKTLSTLRENLTETIKHFHRIVGS